MKMRLLNYFILCIILIHAYAYAADNKYFVVYIGKDKPIAKGCIYETGKSYSKQLELCATLNYRHKGQVKSLYLSATHYNQYSPANKLEDQVLEFWISKSYMFDIPPTRREPEHAMKPCNQFRLQWYIEQLQKTSSVRAFWVNHLKNRSRSADFWYPQDDSSDYYYTEIKKHSRHNRTLHTYRDISTAIQKVSSEHTRTLFAFCPCLNKESNSLKSRYYSRQTMPYTQTKGNVVEFFTDEYAKDWVRVFKNGNKTCGIVYYHNINDRLVALPITRGSHDDMQLLSLRRYEYDMILNLLLSPFIHHGTL